MILFSSHFFVIRSRHSAQAETKIVPLLLLLIPLYSRVILLHSGSLHSHSTQSLTFSQISPVFFVDKKDGSKRIVIDYHNLNNQMVKNNYLLSLIIELIDNMGSKKVFTKIDLR